MYTFDKPRRMSIREFRAALKSDMPLPLIVTSDGQDAFAVVPVEEFTDRTETSAAPPVPGTFPTAPWYPPDLARDS